MREVLWALVCVPMVSGVLACAAGTPAPTTSQLCVPGEQKACACPGQSNGVQICADDGSRYGECTNCVSGAGGGPGTTGAGGMIIVGGSGGALGTGGHGTGGAIGVGGAIGDAAADAPAGTGGAPGAGGAAGATVDGGALDGAGVVDGTNGADAPVVVDGAAGSGGGDAGSDVPVVATGVAITPGPTGLVLGSSNSLGVQGPWYAYADGMGADGSTATGICEARGLHPATACSQVATPAVGSFPNTGGKMCTSGTVALIVAGTNMLPDYGNITGAGIGLDLNNSLGAVPVRSVFNASAKGVTGVSFDLEVVTLPALRVEFPTPADAASTGAAYWGGNASFAPSPVVAGTNVIHWADVRLPVAAPPAFVPTMIQSILFHVPTTIVSASPYSFCVSNLKLLTN